MSEFDLNNEQLEEELSGPAPTKRTKKVVAIDPEDDRANWPVISIDFVDGKPNYEFLGVAGTKKNGRPFSHELQVQRGVDVKVPPSIVHSLNETKETRFHQVKDPMTGQNTMVRADRSNIPWRMVSGGKYC